MGLLEKLGLRKPPIDAFSRWLGDRVGLVFSGSLEWKASGELTPELEELDEKVARFVSDYGTKALEQAVDLWVDRTGGSQLLPMFIRPDWLSKASQLLEASGSAGAGFTALVQTLDRLGVSTIGGLIRDHSSMPDPRTAVPHMLEVVWPFTKAEEAVGVRLRELTKRDTGLVKWELFAIRTWALQMVIAGVLKDDPARGNKLRMQVLKQVEGRATGVAGPDDLTNWIAKRLEGFNAAAMPSGESGAEDTPLLTVVIGRQFARNLESTDSEVRSVGAQAFANAYRELKALVEAWTRNP